MNKKYFLLLALISSFTFGQTSSIDAFRLCNFGQPTPNATGLTAVESGNNYGCLGSQPNSSWYYFKVTSNGDLSFLINQGNNAPSYNNLDVDFICYGPFNALPTVTGTLGSSDIIACSYSATAVETFSLPGVLVGQYYLLMVTNFSNNPGLIQVNALNDTQSYIDCSVIVNNSIKINAFLDFNSNNIQDVGELNFPQGVFTYELNNNMQINNVLTQFGYYYIFDNNTSNSYDFGFEINPLYQSYYALSTSFYNDVLNNVSGNITYNFPITISQVYNDLSVSIVDSSSPRPGFNFTQNLVYTNHSNQTVNGTLSFMYDSALIVNSVSEPGIVNNASGFTFDFVNLLPFETRTILINYSVPVLPVVSLGQNLITNASISVLANETIIANNNFTQNSEIIGSYDPNDKQESHDEEILFSTFGTEDYLFYTIRFENTGTASAINVRIEDLLDSKLDFNTLQMVKSSHDYVLERINANLTWRFDDIELPVSVANTEIGKGFVVYKIKPQAGYAVGDVINNTANIYFDTNAAIVTNTVASEFVSVLNTQDFVFEKYFSVYPSPAIDVLNINKKEGVTLKTIYVYNTLGQQVLAVQNSENIKSINVSNLTSGNYFIVLDSDKGISNAKFIKK